MPREPSQPHDGLEVPVSSAPPEAPDRPEARDRPEAADRPEAQGRATPVDEPAAPAAGRSRAPTRFSWVGIAVLGAAAVIAFTVTLGIFLPAIGALGEAAARDPAALPARIHVCDRDWTKDALGRTLTRDEVFARSDAEPIVVSTGLFAACPAEVYPTGDAADGMATVVYVRVGDDAFVTYELVGGP